MDPDAALDEILDDGHQLTRLTIGGAGPRLRTEPPHRSLPITGPWSLDRNSVEVIAPSGKVALVGLGYPQAGTGSPDRLDFETILNLGPDPEAGVWRLKWVQVGDRVGNQRYVPPSELAAAGFPVSFTV
jgi:hypothetical protein